MVLGGCRGSTGRFVEPSPACFINDLGQAINALNVGIQVKEHCMNLLMYADDIVLTSPNVKSAQKQLDLITSWWKTWGMFINSKSPKFY